MPTLDEKIEAAKALTGYTPGPWMREAQNVYAASGSPCVLSVNSYEYGIDWPTAKANGNLAAAAPDLLRLALDLAAERERLLAICRDVPGVLDSAFAAGIEEGVGGSTPRQEKHMAPVMEMRQRARAALASEPRA